MIGILYDSVYEYLEMYNLLTVEWKGCRNKIQMTKDQLLIDKMVLNDRNKRHANLGMAWTDYKKLYNMISHSWILENLALVQVSENIVQYITKSMKNWNTEVT